MYKFAIFRMRTTRIDNGTHCAPCTRQLIYLFFRLFASTQPHNRISNNANKRQQKQHSKLKKQKRTECELKRVLSKNKHSPETAKNRSTCNPICRVSTHSLAAQLYLPFAVYARFKSNHKSRCTSKITVLNKPEITQQ